MSDVKKWELTDIVRITDNGKEVTTCTGYEICDAFGFARNKGMLYAAIMTLGTHYLDIAVVGQVKDGTTTMEENPQE